MASHSYIVAAEFRTRVDAIEAEDRLKREKMLIEPANEWHFYRLTNGP